MVSVWGLSCRLQEQQFAVSIKEGEQTQWHRYLPVFYRSQDHSHPGAKAQPSRSRDRKPTVWPCSCGRVLGLQKREQDSL